MERQGNTVVYQKIDGDSDCSEWVYTFDDDGHLLSYQETYEDGSGWANSFGQIRVQTIYNYEYDSHGKLTYSGYRETYQDGSDSLSTSDWEYEYDSADRPIISKEYNKDRDLVETVTVSYDADGNVTEENFNWKDFLQQKSFELKREFIYNGEGRLESVTVDGEKEWELSYKSGLLDTVSHYDITNYPSTEEALINTNPVTGFQFVRKYLKDCLGVEFPDDLGDWNIIYGDGSNTEDESPLQNETSSQDESSSQNEMSSQDGALQDESFSQEMP